MTNYLETGEYPPFVVDEGNTRKGRSARDGYARAWGIEYGGLREAVLSDPVYQYACDVAGKRSVQTEERRINLFLLLRYFLPRLGEISGAGSIVEFGSYRGGSALFMAAATERLSLDLKIYALDTFQGMPATDKNIDAHCAGDFGDVDLAELREYTGSCGLSHRLEFVQGTFEQNAQQLINRIAPVFLSHIDCDIRSAAAFAWDVAGPFMAPGGYVVFDDATTSSCLGATEVVEDLAIRRDGLNCEQIWPHFVFRIWPGDAAPPSSPATYSSSQQERAMAAALAAAKRIRELSRELSELQAESALQQALHGEMERQYNALREQVGLAVQSRWLRMGRLLGIGPDFNRWPFVR